MYELYSEGFYEAGFGGHWPEWILIHNLYLPEEESLLDLAAGARRRQLHQSHFHLDSTLVSVQGPWKLHKGEAENPFVNTSSKTTSSIF